MKKSIFVAACAALFAFTPLCAQSLPAQAQSEQTPRKQQVPVDLMTMVRDARCGQVLVNTIVDGVPMRMLLDTGATHTVLHDESVAKLKNPKWLDTRNMQFKGNSAQRPKLLIASLQVGPGVSPTHPVIVVSLAAIRSMMAEKVDGIVGMDILSSLPFTFDFGKNEYYWGTPGTGSLVPLNGTRDMSGRLTLTVKSGEKEFPLLLDTGSSITRIFAENWAPGIAGEITAQVGDVDKASRKKMIEGKPGKLEVAPGVFLKPISPLICDTTEHAILGTDALAESTLIHIPDPNAYHGKFFLLTKASAQKTKESDDGKR